MSTLWTPDGERHVRATPEHDSTDRRSTVSDPSATEVGDAEERMEKLREELLHTKAEEVVANHCYGLFELAALYLSASPPRLKDATIAIDALSGLTDALQGRLGNGEAEIREAVSQLRLAFVQISVIKAEDESPSDSE